MLKKNLNEQVYIFRTQSSCVAQSKCQLAGGARAPITPNNVSCRGWSLHEKDTLPARDCPLHNRPCCIQSSLLLSWSMRTQCGMHLSPLSHLAYAHKVERVRAAVQGCRVIVSGDGQRAETGGILHVPPEVGSLFHPNRNLVRRANVRHSPIKRVRNRGTFHRPDF